MAGLFFSTDSCFLFSTDHFHCTGALRKSASNTLETKPPLPIFGLQEGSIQQKGLVGPNVPIPSNSLRGRASVSGSAEPRWHGSHLAPVPVGEAIPMQQSRSVVPVQSGTTPSRHVLTEQGSIGAVRCIPKPKDIAHRKVFVRNDLSDQICRIPTKDFPVSGTPPPFDKLREASKSLAAWSSQRKSIEGRPSSSIS